jgi:hypothetical protein
MTIENKQFDIASLNVKNRAELTSRQRQVVLGALLGRASIVKPKAGRYRYLMMRQAKKADPRILIYKAEELTGFGRPTAFVEDNHDYRWLSISSPVWNEFYALTYAGGKKRVTMDWLNQLTDMAMMIWFLDNGYMKDEKIGLNTAKFSKKGTELIVQYLNEVGVESELIQERNCYRIEMSEDGSQNFFRIIQHRLPPFARDAL